MITKNEKKVLRYLLVNFDSQFSINEIARACKLSPNGAYKILKKLETEQILQHKTVANVKPYSINFLNKKTKLILELALIEETPSTQFDYLQSLVDVCIVKGSQVILISNKKILRKPANSTILTKNEFITNLQSKRFKETIEKGKILWGQNKLVNIFANAAK